MSHSLKERFRPEDPYARITGMVLVLGGLVVFLVVFFSLFPVLRDPVGIHDHWFPPEEEQPPTETDPAAPRAGFSWVVEAQIAEPEPEPQPEPGPEPEPEPIEGEERQPVFLARFEDLSETGDAPIIRWRWELGDGTVATGPDAEHEYAEPGEYRVRLEVEDENGQTDRISDRIAVPEEGREEGQLEPEEELLDLSGVESSVEDLVATVTRSTQTFVVIGLFGLAAVLLTLLGWRVARVGVMLLRPLPGEPPKRRRRKQAQTEATDSEKAAPDTEEPTG